jgi:hypothetical protein
MSHPAPEPLRITRRASFAAICWVLIALFTGAAGAALIFPLAVAIPAGVMAWACFDIASEPPTPARLQWMGVIAAVAALGGVGLIGFGVVGGSGDAYEAMGMIAGVLGGMLLVAAAATGSAIGAARDWPRDRG